MQLFNSVGSHGERMRQNYVMIDSANDLARVRRQTITRISIDLSRIP